MQDELKSQNPQSGAVPLPLYRLEFHTPAPGTSKRLSIALSLFCLYLLLNPSHFVTAPVRGMPPSAHAPVGRPRCFNFLRKSR